MEVKIHGEGKLLRRNAALMLLALSSVVLACSHNGDQVIESETASPENATSEVSSVAGDRIAWSSVMATARSGLYEALQLTRTGLRFTTTEVDIFPIMSAEGFELRVEEDLADYLPLPPRAVGQVGHFQRDEQTVHVARITYPEVIFAEPHIGWIIQRSELLTDNHERVVRYGGTVIHIVAESEEMADLVMRVFDGDSSR